MGDAFADWAEGLSPWARLAVYDGSMVLVAVVVAWLVNLAIRHVLVSKGVDEYLRFPWTAREAVSTKGPRDQGRKQKCSALSGLIGLFFAATVLAGAFWWLASMHDSPSWSRLIQAATTHAWQAAVVVFPALLISGWLSRTLYDLLRSPWLKEELDLLFPRTTQEGDSFAETVAKALCIVVYAAFLLFVPAAVAGLFNLSSIEGLVVPAWQVCSRLLTALLLFAVGYVGVAWSRVQTERGEDKDGALSDLGRKVGLGIVVITTILALGMLAGLSSGAGSLVFAALLLFLLWPLRPFMRDLWAGFLMKAQRVSELTIDGSHAMVVQLGPLASQIANDGTQQLRRNSELLTAYMESPKKQA